MTIFLHYTYNKCTGAELRFISLFVHVYDVPIQALMDAIFPYPITSMKNTATTTKSMDLPSTVKCWEHPGDPSLHCMKGIASRRSRR